MKIALPIYVSYTYQSVCGSAWLEFVTFAGKLFSRRMSTWDSSEPMFEEVEDDTFTHEVEHGASSYTIEITTNGDEVFLNGIYCEPEKIQEVELVMWR